MLDWYSLVINNAKKPSLISPNTTNRQWFCMTYYKIWVILLVSGKWDVKDNKRTYQAENKPTTFKTTDWELRIIPKAGGRGWIYCVSNKNIKIKFFIQLYIEIFLFIPGQQHKLIFSTYGNIKETDLITGKVADLLTNLKSVIHSIDYDYTYEYVYFTRFERNDILRYFFTYVILSIIWSY